MSCRIADRFGSVTCESSALFLRSSRKPNNNKKVRMKMKEAVIYVLANGDFREEGG